jgi:hypothetical protein
MISSQSLRYLSSSLAVTKCHAGSGEGSCRFLAFGGGGFQCLAVIAIYRATMAQAVAAGQLGRLGDACADPWDDTSQTVLTTD